MELKEIIKILRKHNETGKSVQRLTAGRYLEVILLRELLDKAEGMADYLQRACDDFQRIAFQMEDEDGNCCTNSPCTACVCQQENTSDRCKWRFEDEVMKLIGRKQ